MSTRGRPLTHPRLTAPYAPAQKRTILPYRGHAPLCAFPQPGRSVTPKRKVLLPPQMLLIPSSLRPQTPAGIFDCVRPQHTIDCTENLESTNALPCFTPCNLARTISNPLTDHRH